MPGKRRCRLMCIVAHPDDEAQCAGAILRETPQGEWAVVVWMTNGSKGWSLREESSHTPIPPLSLSPTPPYSHTPILPTPPHALRETF